MLAQWKPVGMWYSVNSMFTEGHWFTLAPDSSHHSSKARTAIRHFCTYDFTMEHETIRLRNCLGFEKRHSLLAVTQNFLQMRMPRIGVVYLSRWWMFCFKEEIYFFSSLLCVWKDKFSGRNNLLYSETGSIIETEFSLV